MRHQQSSAALRKVSAEVRKLEDVLRKHSDAVRKVPVSEIARFQPAKIDESLRGKLVHRMLAATEAGSRKIELSEGACG